MTATAFAPIRKTQFARRLTHGGAGRTRNRECWGAETTDGAWEFEREESPGTPWIVHHKPTQTLVAFCGTLRACQAYVAAGHAQADLDRCQAHDRGEHAAKRDPSCGRC